jgi:DNA polymerase III subunit epsilon
MTSMVPLTDTPIGELPICFLDVETTGGLATRDRVIELAVHRYEAGVFQTGLASFVNSGCRVPAFITRLTTIDDAMLVDAPTFDRLITRIIDIMSRTVIVGHKVRFDLAFLFAEFSRAGRSFKPVLESVQALCTMKLARRIDGRGEGGLQGLLQANGLTGGVPHRAEGDVLSTAVLFSHLVERAGGRGLTLGRLVQLQGGPLNLAEVYAARPESTAVEPGQLFA